MNRYRDLVRYNLTVAKAVYTKDNEVEIFTDGKAYFRQLAKEIEKAEHFIHIQSYIIKNDGLWRAMEKLLVRKAGQGVQVRILYDSMGCRTMKPRDWARIRRAGVQTAEFFPALFGRFHLRMNYRNHRKNIVIDGKTAYVGGFNIGKEYLGLDRWFGPWRDTHLEIRGSAVRSLHRRFLADWKYAAKQNLFSQPEMRIFGERGKGKAGIQIISGGPDKANAQIRDNYLKLITNARDHIYIQTPYLIPDEVILNAVKMASYTGVEVKIMIPCKPDHPLVYWANRSYVGELLEAGIKCYTYENGFLHARGVTSDGLVCCYGSANLDVRSFWLNYEMNATIFSREITKKLEEQFERDLQYCTEITLQRYERRGINVRRRERFSRMFSFIL